MILDSQRFANYQGRIAALLERMVAEQMITVVQCDHLKALFVSLSYDELAAIMAASGSVFVSELIKQHSAVVIRFLFRTRRTITCFVVRRVLCQLPDWRYFARSEPASLLM